MYSNREAAHAAYTQKTAAKLPKIDFGKVKTLITKVGPALLESHAANILPILSGLTLGAYRYDLDQSRASEQRALNKIDAVDRARASGNIENIKKTLQSASSPGWLYVKQEPSSLPVHLAGGALFGYSFQPRYLYKTYAPMWKHAPVRGNEVTKDSGVTPLVALGSSAAAFELPNITKAWKRIYNNIEKGTEKLSESGIQDSLKKVVDAVPADKLKCAVTTAADAGDTLRDVTKSIKKTSDDVQKSVSGITSTVDQFRNALPSRNQLLIGGGLTAAGIIALVAWRNAAERRSRAESDKRLGKAIAKGLRHPSDDEEDDNTPNK